MADVSFALRAQDKTKKAVNSATKNFRGLTDALTGKGGKGGVVGAFGQLGSAAGLGIGALGGAGAIGLIASATRKIEEVDTILARAAPNTNMSLGSMRDAVLDLGTTVALDLPQIADIYVAAVEKFGEANPSLQSTAALLGNDFTPGARTASDGVADITTAVGNLSRIWTEVDPDKLIYDTAAAMDVFGVPAEDAGTALALLVGKAEEADIPVNRLAEILVTQGPKLTPFNVGLATATDLFGDLIGQGTPIENVMSGLNQYTGFAAKNGITDLNTGLKDAITNIQTAESDTEALSLAQQYFGREAAPVMVNAINTGVLDALLKTDEQTAATTERLVGMGTEVFTLAADTQTSADKQQLAWNNVTATLGRWGSNLGTTIEFGVNLIEFLVNSWRALGLQIALLVTDYFINPFIGFYNSTLNVTEQVSNAFGHMWNTIVGFAETGVNGFTGAINSVLGFIQGIGFETTSLKILGKEVFPAISFKPFAGLTQRIDPVDFSSAELSTDNDFGAAALDVLGTDALTALRDEAYLDAARSLEKLPGFAQGIARYGSLFGAIAGDATGALAAQRLAADRRAALTIPNNDPFAYVAGLTDYRSLNRPAPVPVTAPTPGTGGAGAGPTGPNIQVVVNGDTYGIDDAESFIQRAVRQGLASGEIVIE